MQARLEWSDLQLLKALLVFLEIQCLIQRSISDHAGPSEAGRLGQLEPPHFCGNEHYN